MNDHAGPWWARRFLKRLGLVPGLRPPQRHNQNVDGPFYVVKVECISCGAPELHAPGLMSHDPQGHCFFARQPNGQLETNKAIEATWVSCCGAVRYGGTDHETLVRLAEIGLSERCDYPQVNKPNPRPRTFVSFQFAAGPNAAEAPVKVITTYLADFFRSSSSENGKVLSLQFSMRSASFIYEWGHDLLPQPCCVKFTIAQESDLNRWAVQISREDGYPTTGFAIDLHNALVSDLRFHSIQWFTDEERNTRMNLGHFFPY